MNINVNIERLILDGLPIRNGQREFLKTAVEAELGRLLSANGLKQDFLAGGAVPSLKAGDIQLSDSRPAGLGQQIARAVYGGIGK